MRWLPAVSVPLFCSSGGRICPSFIPGMCNHSAAHSVSHTIGLQLLHELSCTRLLASLLFCLNFIFIFSLSEWSFGNQPVSALQESSGLLTRVPTGMSRLLQPNRSVRLSLSCWSSTCISSLFCSRQNLSCLSTRRPWWETELGYQFQGFAL